MSPRPIRPSRLSELLARSRTKLAPLDLVAVCDQLRDWTAAVATGGGGGGRTYSVADPTGTAATTTAADYAAGVRARIEYHVMTIDAHAASLAKLCALVTDPPPLPDPADRGLIQCANVHGCPDEAWAEKAGRCGACYQHHRRHDGRDRRLSGAPRHTEDLDAGTDLTT